jgi:hypothetical protein
VPLLMADTFTGAPGFSSPMHEAEFAWAKPRCDVLVNGSACAPGGTPARRVPVGVRIGGWRKTFDVVGDRVWVQRGLTPGPSTPAPFVSMPITYDRAFGGVDDCDPDRPRAYPRNPVGRGYGLVRSGERLLGRPVPNTEDPHNPVRVPWGEYEPKSLGPVHRSWQPRLALAGTYDQRWLDEVFPFLPADFNVRHFQSAPEDQQIDPPAGGEEVVLLNLTPAGRVQFRLPRRIDVPVTFFFRDDPPAVMRSTLDTVSLQPDSSQVCMVWRCTRPLQRDVFEVIQAVAGHLSSAWWRAHRLSKTYYPGLGSFVRQQRIVDRVET